jgi:hypothetical protein
VDDAPLVVQTVGFSPRGEIVLHLSDGTSEPLDPATLRIDADDVPYCDVKQRTLPARFARAAAFALLEHVRADDDRYVLVLPSGEHPLRRVGRGEGAPKRAPARPEE